MSATAQATETAPIVLTPNVSPLDPGRWKPFVEDVELSCYSYHLPHAASDDDDDDDDNNDNDDVAVVPAALPSSRLDDWYRALHPSSYVDEPRDSAWTDASHAGRPLLRKSAWSVFDIGCKCEYGYSDNWQRLVSCTRMINVLREITSEVSRIVGGGGGGGGGGEGEFNSVNLNYYPRGGGIGYHADDEYLFDGTNRPTRVVSLSLCDRRGDDGDDDDTDIGRLGERLFQVKRRKAGTTTTGGGDVAGIALRHGDLVTMEGMFQRHYLHSVWPGDDDDRTYVDHEGCRGERINLTWRTIVRHLDGSDECRGLVCPLATGGGECGGA